MLQLLEGRIGPEPECPECRQGLELWSKAIDLKIEPKLSQDFLPKSGQQISKLTVAVLDSQTSLYFLSFGHPWSSTKHHGLGFVDVIWKPSDDLMEAGIVMECSFFTLGCAGNASGVLKGRHTQRHVIQWCVCLVLAFCFSR